MLLWIKRILDCANSLSAQVRLLAIVLVCTVLHSAWAADEAIKPSQPSQAVPASTADVVQRLDAVNQRLISINDYLRKPAPDLAGINVALPGKSQEAKSVLADAEVADPSRADLVELAAVLQKLRGLDRIFAKWRARLQAEIALLDPWREQLNSDASFLRQAAERADAGATERDQLPYVLEGRLRAVANEIESSSAPLRKRLDVVVASDVRVGELQSSLRELQTQLDSARMGRQERPLAITSPALWNLPTTWRLPLDTARQNFRTLREGITDYVAARPTELTVFALVLLALLIAVARLRRSVISRGQHGTEHRLLTQYPFAVTLLVWTLVGPFLLLSDLPLGLNLLRGLLDAVLLWRILPALVTPAETRPLKGLFLLAVAFLLLLTVLGDNWYGRVLTVVLGVAAVLVFRALSRIPAASSRDRLLYWRAIIGVAVIAPAVIGIGLIAEVVGARSLAQQAIGGVVFSSLALCTLLAADAILRSILDAWVTGPGARWFRSVRHWPEAVRTWGHRIILIVLLIAFVNLVPTILPILEPAWQGAAEWVATSRTVGNVELAPRDVFWFIAGIILALGAARFIRFLLDEDVLPRMPLALGAASAASRLIYYALIVLGILFSLAAAGVELTKLTLVISALGVGIGFGLQNIVNNFVSGLILAFERPVREGDQITLGQTTGRVNVIGLRATRIRTPDGAEVIVPNANLISDQVTNWTLSDRTRRIDIVVGVDYSSDPAEVQAVLLDAVKDMTRLATVPEPMTYFRAFGDSSLDFLLLLWAKDFDDRFALESEARTRVFQALRAAGINIPFPQRDLHIRDGTLPSGEVSPSR